MNRPGFGRSKRRHHFRLTLEHLESRRLMAGLNVLVFTDQDGSRSLSPAYDQPAPNRLVYVDLNRNFRFEDGEPLAASGADGIARFPNLSAGDYLISLFNANPSQAVTTSITSDPYATPVVQIADSQAIIGSSDLKNAWSISSNGKLTPVGSDNSGRPATNLGGPVTSFVNATSTNDASGNAWALVEYGGTQPLLMQLNPTTGVIKQISISGVPTGGRVTGLARAGDLLVAQIETSSRTLVAPITVASSSVTLGAQVEVPSGRIVGSNINGQLAVYSNKNGNSTISSVRLTSGAPSISSLPVDGTISSLVTSGDGNYLLASMAAGGMRVFSTFSGVAPAAILADASGPVSASRFDGRFVTASSGSNELIVWDSRSWMPVSRISVGDGKSPINAVAVDSFGSRLLVSTTAGVFSASLDRPLPQSVKIENNTQTADALIGVRLTGAVTPLPTQIVLDQKTEEDSPLSFDLSSDPALAGLSTSQLLFAPLSGPSLGTVVVTPTGKVNFLPAANANGSDAMSFKVFDGINASTVIVSLDVRAVNDPPSSFIVSASGIAEAAVRGDAAGTAVVFDVDEKDSYYITVNDPRFEVVNGRIVRTDVGTLDFETEPFVDLELVAADMEDASYSIARQVRMPIFDSNDAPRGLIISSLEVTENNPGETLGNVQVDEVDGHGSYIFTVSDQRFEVVGGQLRLKSGKSLDYEAEAEVALVVSVTDPTAEGPEKSYATTVVVNVLDANDAITGLSVSGDKVKSRELGAIVGQVLVIDQDTNDSYAITVSDPRFEVDGGTLKLKPDQSLDAKKEKNVPILVSVEDAGGTVVSQTVTVKVVNDAPFQNPRNPLDVDGDGNVYARDILIIINELNHRGAHVIEPSSATGEDSSGNPVYVDVNGDGMVTALDALILINHINKRSATRSSAPGGEGEYQPPVYVSKSAAADVFMVSQLDDNVDVGGSCPAFQPASPPIESMFAMNDTEKARRDQIDAELEQLVEQLSREKLR